MQNRISKLLLFSILIASAAYAKRDPGKSVDWNAKLKDLDKKTLLLISDFIRLKGEVSDEKRFFFSPFNTCEGRLTLETGVGVSTSDQTAKSTIYFTPFLGSAISLYDGSGWTMYRFTELSLALSGLTSGANYDVFLYDNASTLTLELSAAWTNDTTRADALTTVNGVFVKSSATTRRLVGTIRTTSTTTTEDSAAKRFVWSQCNRKPRFFLVTEATDSWAYATDSWRAVNGSTANRVEFVLGDTNDMVRATTLSLATASSGQVNYVASGVGVDSVTTNSSTLTGSSTDASTKVQITSEYSGYPGLGYHYLQWLERGAATSVTFYGDAGDNTLYQAGMIGEIF